MYIYKGIAFFVLLLHITALYLEGFSATMHLLLQPSENGRKFVRIFISILVQLRL